MRSVLLYLSTQRRLRRWMETSAAAQRLAGRFVAGESLEEAVDAARRAAGEGLTVTLDHLGENVTSLTEAAASCEESLRALDALGRAGLEPNVSIKLTQFGIDLDVEACRRHVERLVCAAAGAPGGFVRVDMESSVYTERTLRLVGDLHARHPGAAGAVIQSYLYRSEDDVARLNAAGIRVRLCKGAYLEPPSVAFPEKSAVDANYIRLMKDLLGGGVYPAIATHDEAMIEATRRFAAERAVGAGRFEFQMLYGIRRDLQRRLAAAGYRVRLYVPYGKAWYPYFMRRLAERPANLLFLARNLWR